MADKLSSWHRIAYACYLFVGLIGVVGIFPAGDSEASVLGAMLAAMVLAVVMPLALILSAVLRKERVLLLLAGLTVGIPLAWWLAATLGPQNQIVAGWYVGPAACVLVVASARKLLRNEPG
jgi:hypothetical protein